MSEISHLPEPYHSQSPEAYNSEPRVFASVEERNAWIDDTVDPDRTLPLVKLVPREDSGSMNIVSQINGVESTVGSCTLRENVPYYPDMKHFKWIEVDEKKKGYGLATYLAVMKTFPLDQGMRSDSKLSWGSYSLWRKLEKMGLAVSDTTNEVVSRSWDAGGVGKGETDIIRFRTVFGEHDSDKLTQMLIEKIHVRSQEHVARLAGEQEERHRNTSLLHRFLGRLGLK
ncbi:MAG: hypothetical protein NVSMB46_01060 [Candidatus Saccharimonadales bacterium]